jgi:adenylosuccinate lyase
VSCSVVRRVMLPDAFFAIDGLFETFLTILEQMDAWPALIAAETQRYLPFLMTTTIMMEAVKAGVGRESAHLAIKQHALATVNDLRHGTVACNNLIERLAADTRLGLSRPMLEAIVASGDRMVGAARSQVAAFSANVRQLEAANPVAAAYVPGAIL